MKKARTFRRDAFLGIRMPEDDKKRLFEISRRRRRDASSYALEFIMLGVAKTEVEIQKQPAGM
jgi:predicted DNA-binding protein